MSTGIKGTKDSRFLCSDCTTVFSSRGLRAHHALKAGHMKEHTCFDCQSIFDSPNALKRHKTLHKTLPPATSMSASNTPEVQPHFSTKHWRESDNPELALRSRPGHNYTWASPALSGEVVHALLVAELLTLRRRGLEGFPTTATMIPGPARPSLTIAAADNRPLPLPRPDPTGARKTYSALVVDCEMVELADRVVDLVRVTVVDFFTGAIVVNNLVQPTASVKDWRSRVSGVDGAILHAAHRDPEATVLQGWPEARARIFAVADADTVFVGHALPNDLKILRIAADRVVDSLVVTAHAVFGVVGSGSGSFPRTWGLKSGCKALLGVDVQPRAAAHDPLEDALATRELVIWCLTHPDALREWGIAARAEFDKAEEARRRKQIAEAEERRRKRQEEEAKAEAEAEAEAQAAGSVW
ncbi:hypothetical protein F5Y14DRAFT_402286 [Nemania sp. NC0429]|nr:hypothetical protein F5Y14DRAFT_402286 [Nemania sp. NC0429]